MSQRIQAKPTQEQNTTTDKLHADTCPECSGDVRMNPTETENICMDCGLVISEDNIDHGPEWRAYNSREQQQKSRVGSPLTNLQHDKGLSTTIGNDTTDANGSPLSSKKRAQISRLSREQTRSQASSSKDRNLRDALGELQRLKSELNIPNSTAETAAKHYKKAVDEGLLPGRSIEGVVTAALKIAMRNDGIPRSDDEIESYAHVEIREFNKAMFYIAQELGLGISPPEPVDYVPKVASSLEVSVQTRQKAEAALKAYSENGNHSGNDPNGLAGAAIYIVNELRGRPEDIIQDEVGSAADVTAVTIRNRKQDIRQFLEENDLLHLVLEDADTDSESTDQDSGGEEVSSSEDTTEEGTSSTEEITLSTEDQTEETDASTASRTTDEETTDTETEDRTTINLDKDSVTTWQTSADRTVETENSHKTASQTSLTAYNAGTQSEAEASADTDRKADGGEEKCEDKHTDQSGKDEQESRQGTESEDSIQEESAENDSEQPDTPMVEEDTPMVEEDTPMVEEDVVTVAVESGETQADAMVRFVNTLVTEEGLLDEISLPYTPKGYTNTWLNSEPRHEDDEKGSYGTWNQACSSEEAESDVHVFTKLAGRDKKKRMKGMAELCGLTFEVEDGF